MPRKRLPITHQSATVRAILMIFDESGLGNEELAELAGISASTVSSLRNKGKYSSIQHIEWIGQALGYKLRWHKIGPHSTKVNHNG